MILGRKYFKQLNSWRKFRVSLFLSHPQKILSLFFQFFAIWVFFQFFCPALVHWIFKNTKDDFSATHSSCRQRMKPLGTGYTYFIWGLWPHPIQWEWGNVVVTYKLFVFGIPIYSSPLDQTYLRPTSFIRKILDSSHLS